MYVKTGREHYVVDEIINSRLLYGTKSFIPTYDVKFKKSGNYIMERRKLFSGYVFVESEINGIDFYMMVKPFINNSQNVLKLLRYGTDYEGNLSFQVKDSEKEMYLGLYNEEFCVEISKGLIVGDRIKITKGPLVGHGSIIKNINRHKMQAKVEIEFMGCLREITIELEVVEKL